MKAEIGIDKRLLEAAEAMAAAKRETLSTFVESALRIVIVDARDESEKRPATMPTYGSGGPYPGVLLDDTSDLLDRADGLK